MSKSGTLDPFGLHLGKQHQLLFSRVRTGLQPENGTFGHTEMAN